MRSFFAVLADEPIKQLAQQMIEELHQRLHGDLVRWTPLEKLHVTLQFLGDTSSEQLAYMDAQLPAILKAMPRFSIELDRLALFPTQRHPKVIALLFKPSAELTQLAELIKGVAANAGIAVENRPFRSHLSLGRIKTPPYPTIDGIIVADKLMLPVNEITLLDSQFQAGSSIYVPLTTIGLAAVS